MRSARLLSTVAIAVGLLSATACSGSDETTDATGDAGAPADAATGDAAATDEAFPTTITSAFGEVTLDQEPVRVVALGWSDAETALALGVEPVGATDWLGFGGDGVGPWADGLYATSPTLIESLEPDLEAVAALEPDVILDTRSDGTEERYAALSQIAPVVGAPADVVPYGTTWQQQVELVGQALGRRAEADALIAQVEDRFAEVAAANPEFAGTEVAVGAYSAEGYGAYVQGDARVEFLEQLGFVNDPELDALASGDFFVPISNEEVTRFDADLTVMFPIFVEATEITEDPLWQQVPSVADGRAVVLDDPDALNAFSSASALGILYALDEVVPLFADALAAGEA